MPKGIYRGVKCEYWHDDFHAKQHQTFVKDYFVNSPYKGLLLFHKLGSGKTCSSIITADALLRLENIKYVYLFTPGSLRQGWVNEYCGVCGENEKYLSENYVFITYNYEVYNRLPPNLDNSLIIIDEVHNLINNYLNFAKNGTVIYNRIYNSKNSKILALSGTPIYDNIWEWSALGNLLKPGAFPNVMGDKQLHENIFMDLFLIEEAVFETEEQFNKSTISDRVTLEVKNPDAFYKSLEGIISYFPGGRKEDYPEIIHEPIQAVQGSDILRGAYEYKVYIEYKILSKIQNYMSKNNIHSVAFLPAKMKESYTTASLHVMSRKLLNFIYPSVGEVIDFDGELIADKLEIDGGWIKKEYFSNGQLLHFSPKMTMLIHNILSNLSSKHVVYTFFKKKAGVNMLQTIFKMCASSIKTEIFSGDKTSYERYKILQRFNDPKNRNGDHIKILFITDAGAEGINLLEVEHMHILESGLKPNKIEQVIGRAVRYKSHVNMPKERQYVHVWRYWTVFQSDKPLVSRKISDGTNTYSIVEFQQEGVSLYPVWDEAFYIKGQYKLELIRQFQQLLINASIENNIK